MVLPAGGAATMEVNPHVPFTILAKLGVCVFLLDFSCFRGLVVPRIMGLHTSVEPTFWVFPSLTVANV